MFKLFSKKLCSEKGEVYVGEGVKIVLCIVLGAALLAGMVLVATKVILPKTEKYIIALFDKGDDSMLDVALDSMNITERDKQDLRLELAHMILMQTEEYRQAEAVCQGSDAEFLAALACVPKAADAPEDVVITREEADAAFQEYLNANEDEYQVQLANSYFALRDRYDSEEFQTKSNGFTRDYMKLYVDYERGKMTEEERVSELQKLGDSYGVDTSEWI